jgi:DNA-binding MarR family transcriptional regulator
MVRKTDHHAIHQAGLAVQAQKGGFPASHEVARVLGLHPRTVMRALDSLAEAGLVERYRTGAKYLDPGQKTKSKPANEIRVRAEVGKELLAILSRYRQDHFPPTAHHFFDEVEALAASLVGERLESQERDGRGRYTGRKGESK